LALLTAVYDAHARFGAALFRIFITLEPKGHDGPVPGG